MTLRVDFNADAACLEAKTFVYLFRDSAEPINCFLTVIVQETSTLLALAQSSTGHSPSISLLQDPTSQIAIAFSLVKEIEIPLSVNAASQELSLM